MLMLGGASAAARCKRGLTGTMGREIRSGDLWSQSALGLPSCMIRSGYLSLPPDAHYNRLQLRGADRDAPKLLAWDPFVLATQAQL